MLSLRPHLMVVDDDSAIRAMLQTALERDYSVVCFPNGEEAILSMDIQPPRLLILDIHIPRRDGADIAKRVRQQAKLKKLPVLFMTIRKDDAAFLKTIESGGAAVIGKPFEISDLRERIADLLGRRPIP